MNRTRRIAARLLALTLLVVPILTAPAVGMARAAAGQEDDDIDVFMEKVLERRVTNWEDLYRYTVRDREVIDVKGPGGVKIESQVGEYTWYVRDGYMVRSPDTLNGAKVGDAEREKAENRFLKRVRKRDEERAEKDVEADEERGEGDEAPDEAGAEREYFLGFPFEPGNYYLAGFEDFEGQEVARIEYYPQELFEDGDEEDAGDADAEDADDGGIEDAAADEWTQRFQKTSRVTLWVLVDRHQIVKVAYDNVGLDFLPYRWLVQVEDIRAELVMHQPFPDEDVWLPRDIVVEGEFSVATGAYTMSYTLEYFGYQETDVAAKVRFRFPGMDQQDE